MAVWRSPADVPTDLGRTVVTIGVFDGVHRGHQMVLERAGQPARDAGLPVVAVTFHPHPMEVIRPESAPAALSSVDHRAVLLRASGADHVLVLPFDKARAQQPPDEFVADVLVATLHARVVVVGADFRFGHRAAGDVGLLERLGPDHDYTVDVVEIAGGEGVERWSSTHIRERLADGDIAAANRALGRPYRLEGVVVRGSRRGKDLGFPTANVPAPDSRVVPADGVYAGWLTRLDDPGAEQLPAAISVGTKPTFGPGERTVEPYVLDRDDLDLYGVAVAVDFVARVRGQWRFDTADELVARMHEDVAAVRAVLQA